MSAGRAPPKPRPWPDWAGQGCAIIASGPSVKAADVALLRGRVRVLAIKKNVELAPWADAVYGCDFAWWRAVRGLPDFAGRKFAWADKAVDAYGLTKVELLKSHATSNDLLFDRPGLVGGGGCSGFQALNLVAQWGARRILLLGFDCQDRSGTHWYGRNMAAGQGNPTASQFRRWKPAFDAAAPVLAGLGTDVVNASNLSDLAAYRRQSVSATLAEWGLS